MHLEPKTPGVHLVGSLPSGTSTTDVFNIVGPALSGRLRRIADGEPAERHFFVFWQTSIFAGLAPQVIVDFPDFDKVEEIPEEQIEANMGVIRANAPLKTGYDNAAIASYKEFCRAREQGKIEPGVRFQVALPTAINTLLLVRDPYRKPIEPLYEEALMNALVRMQREIPHEDLAIQFDLAADIGLLERSFSLNPWFEPLMEGVVERLAKLVALVEEKVEVGLHLCYGDIGHEHFKQPKSLRLLIDLYNMIVQQIGRPFHWLHMPVPKDRNDAAYFEPLKGIKLSTETELYLGLIHPNDEEGSKTKLKLARTFIDRDIGVATECGMGRTPVEDFEPILKASIALSAQVTTM